MSLKFKSKVLSLKSEFKNNELIVHIKFKALKVWFLVGPWTWDFRASVSGLSIGWLLFDF